MGLDLVVAIGALMTAGHVLIEQGLLGSEWIYVFHLQW